MSKTVTLLDIANREYLDSKQFYELEQQGLGLAFKAEVGYAIMRIQQFPQLGDKSTSDTRRVLLTRFPFQIFYKEYDSHIAIISISHQHRCPDYWVNRL